MYIYIYMCVYTHIYIYTYIYTHVTYTYKYIYMACPPHYFPLLRGLCVFQASWMRHVTHTTKSCQSQFLFGFEDFEKLYQWVMSHSHDQVMKVTLLFCVFRLGRPPWELHVTHALLSHVTHTFVCFSWTLRNLSSSTESHTHEWFMPLSLLWIFSFGSWDVRILSEPCHTHERVVPLTFLLVRGHCVFLMRVKCHVGEQRHTLLTESGALLLGCRALLTEYRALLAGYILCRALLI